jgi:hypothetical protein
MKSLVRALENFQEKFLEVQNGWNPSFPSKNLD